MSSSNQEEVTTCDNCSKVLNPDDLQPGEHKGIEKCLGGYACSDKCKTSTCSGDTFTCDNDCCLTESEVEEDEPDEEDAAPPTLGEKFVWAYERDGSLIFRSNRGTMSFNRANPNRFYYRGENYICYAPQACGEIHQLLVEFTKDGETKHRIVVLEDVPKSLLEWFAVVPPQTPKRKREVQTPGAPKKKPKTEPTESEEEEISPGEKFDFDGYFADGDDGDEFRFRSKYGILTVRWDFLDKCTYRRFTSRVSLDYNCHPPQPCGNHHQLLVECDERKKFVVLTYVPNPLLQDWVEPCQTPKRKREVPGAAPAPKKAKVTLGEKFTPKRKREDRKTPGAPKKKRDKKQEYIAAVQRLSETGEGVDHVIALRQHGNPLGVSETNDPEEAAASAALQPFDYNKRDDPDGEDEY